MKNGNNQKFLIAKSQQPSLGEFFANRLYNLIASLIGTSQSSISSAASVASSFCAILDEVSNQ